MIQRGVHGGGERRIVIPFGTILMCRSPAARVTPPHCHHWQRRTQTGSVRCVRIDRCPAYYSADPERGSRAVPVMNSCRALLCAWCTSRAVRLVPRAPAARALPSRGVSSCAPRGPGETERFRPDRVAVVTKTTRYEFEQQRYRYAGMSEEELKMLLALKGSSYNGLLQRHNIHSENVEHIVESLRNEGIEVRLVKRRDYDEETVRWADAIISAGGDGTMLLAASKVQDRFKPVIGVNTDPVRSEGHLCLPVRYTKSFPEALRKLFSGEFRWLWRQRMRLHLEGTGINLTPVDLHDQQLSLEQHNKAHHHGVHPEQTSPTVSGPHLLPVRALNEVFIGESLSSRVNYKFCKPRFTFSLHRASYYEISVDDGPWEKQKSSGLNVCTGTGSKAWSYNINKMAPQTVKDILNIVNSRKNLNLTLDRDLIERVTNEYNDSLIFNPEEQKMFFSVREPIANRVFSSICQRGFTSKVCVHSRCWDACMVVDGGTSFEFNDGAIVTIVMDGGDALCTVLLDE